MVISSCRIICFSPTNSTRKIAEAVAGGLGYHPCVVTDITDPEERAKASRIGADELVILAVPVYYGRVQKHASEYIRSLHGEGQPAVLVVNYGNRHYDDALLELHTLASEAGFVPLAAGAFISEHSLSTRDFPMALGRPESGDIAKAAAFGASVAEKLASGGGRLATVPGNVPYRPYPDAHRAPVNTDNCTLCETCVKICPTAAIWIEDGKVLTREPDCIGCQACVKYCPEGAREDSAPGAREVRERVASMTAERREPEVFL